MRGDPPFPAYPGSLDLPSTPHARGSTFGKCLIGFTHGVYPACAGIHPRLSLPSAGCSGLPRMRGDPPLFTLFLS